MIKTLICTAWSVVLVLAAGFELGEAIEAVVNRKYYRAGMFAALSLYALLHIVKVVFCW